MDRRKLHNYVEIIVKVLAFMVVDLKVLIFNTKE